jgi:hypothetical protein
MCSYDSVALVKYGVEVACPARLVYDPVVQVCTFPATAAQSNAAAASSKGLSTSAAGAAVSSSKAVATPSQSQVAGGNSAAKQTQKKPVSRSTMVERAPAASKP